MARSPRKSLLGDNTDIDSDAVDTVNGSSLLTSIINRDAERSGRKPPFQAVSSQETPEETIVDDDLQEGESEGVLARKHAPTQSRLRASTHASTHAREQYSTHASETARERDSTHARTRSRSRVIEIESTLVSMRDSTLTALNTRIPEAFDEWMDDYLYAHRKDRTPSGKPIRKQDVVARALELFIGQTMMQQANQEEGK